MSNDKKIECFETAPGTRFSIEYDETVPEVAELVNKLQELATQPFNRIIQYKVERRTWVIYEDGTREIRDWERRF